MKISAAEKKTQGYEMVKSKTRYQDIAKKFETAAKGKKTEKQLLRLQNSLQMVPQFRD